MLCVNVLSVRLNSISLFLHEVVFFKKLQVISNFVLRHIIHRGKSTYQKCASHWNFTSLAHPCNEHPDQERGYYRQPSCPVPLQLPSESPPPVRVTTILAFNGIDEFCFLSFFLFFFINALCNMHSVLSGFMYSISCICAQSILLYVDIFLSFFLMYSIPLQEYT